jgi:hypothetical protein
MLEDGHIELSIFNPDMQLNTITKEDTDNGPLPEDIDNHSRAYLSSSR